jgi:hypothetical protein
MHKGDAPPEALAARHKFLSMQVKLDIAAVQQTEA